MKYGCPLLLNALVIRPDGEVTPCCLFTDFENRPSDLNVSHEDYFNHPYLKKIRENCKNDQPHVGCTKCYDQEKIVGESYRTEAWTFQDQYGAVSLRDKREPYLSYVDVHFSNLCNNSCRMCNPNLSTHWYADAKKLVELDTQKQRHFAVPLPKGVVKNNLIDNGDFSKVKCIKFLGGEPLLEQDKMITLLQKCNISDLSIQLITNTTTIPNSHLIRLLKKCKNVTIVLSVDSYGTMNDFLRKGSDWNVTKEVIEWFTKNFDNIIIRSIASIYNINILDKLMDYCSTLNNVYHDYHMLNGPDYMTIRNLPNIAKNKVAKRIKKWAATDKYKRYYKFFQLVLEEIQQEGDVEKFKYMDSLMNKIRNEHWRKINPELNKWVSSGS